MDLTASPGSSVSGRSSLAQQAKSVGKGPSFHMLPVVTNVLTLGLLAGIAVVFLAWQWHEWETDKLTAKEILRSQAESLCKAVIGAIRSHRRLGTFFDQQIQIVLDELVDSHDVLGGGVADETCRFLLRSGSEELQVPEGDEALVSEGYLFRRAFQLQALPAEGFGREGGRGFGWGRYFREAMEATHPSPFAQGGTFSVVLLLDRSDYDTQIWRSARSRWLAVGTGLGCISLVAATWFLASRASRAEHERRMAEISARHYEELGQAATGLVHETRNPLGLIRGWAQKICQNQELDSPLAHEARLVMEECDRLAARLTQFLSFAKPCRPKLHFVDPDEIIAQLLMLLESDCQAKAVRCEHICSAQPLKVEADPDLLRQALFNLLHNAVKFTKHGSLVQVRTQVSGAFCTIEIQDEGPGVAREHVSRLFTPYFTTDPWGTGLGLALVRRVVELHGWEIQYRPGSNGGSIFRLMIPLPEKDTDLARGASSEEDDPLCIHHPKSAAGLLSE